MAQRGITKNSLTSDISAEHFAALFKSLYAMSGICKAFDSLACTKVDNNTVRLASGIYSLSGYMVMVDPGTTEDLTIDSGTSGQNRNDLVVAEFVRNGDGIGADILHFTIVKGTSTSGSAVDPVLEQQDINAAGVTRQETLYRVKIVGIDIISIERVAPLIETDLTSHKAEIATNEKYGHVKIGTSTDDVISVLQKQGIHSTDVVPVLNLGGIPVIDLDNQVYLITAYQRNGTISGGVGQWLISRHANYTAVVDEIYKKQISIDISTGEIKLTGYNVGGTNTLVATIMRIL